MQPIRRSEYHFAIHQHPLPLPQNGERESLYVLKQELRAQYEGQEGTTPLGGPIDLAIDYTLAPPHALAKRVARGDSVFASGRASPELEKLNCFVIKALTSVVIGQKQQIVGLHAVKGYGEDERYAILVRRVALKEMEPPSPEETVRTYDHQEMSSSPVEYSSTLGWT